jgi:phage-related protein
VLTALAPLLNVVAAAIQPLIAPLTSVIELLGPILVDAITSLMPVIELLATFLGGALGVAIQVVASVLEALAPIITVVLDALQPLIEALEPLFQLLGVVADLIGTVLGPIIQVLGAGLLWLVDNVIIPFVIPVIELLINLLAAGLGATIQWVVQQFQGAGEGLAVIFNFIREAGQVQVDAMIAAWRVLSTSFQVAWSVINARVFTPLKNGINTVKSVVSAALSGIRSSWDSFVSFIKGIPGKISGALSNMFSPLATGFKSAINSVIRGWNSLSFSVPSVDLGPLGSVGGFTVSTPNIPLLASGALATGPTLAMVGEGRFNEAILPLGDPRVDSLLASALSRAGAGNQDARGGGDTINATGVSGDNYFVVKIGDREITDIVVEKQNEMNRNQLRRARAGTGRLA